MEIDESGQHYLKFAEFQSRDGQVPLCLIKVNMTDFFIFFILLAHSVKKGL